MNRAGRPVLQQLRRRAVIGFTVGFTIAAPAAWLAIASPLGEDLKPYLLPGLLLLAPLQDDFRSTPGLVSVLAGALANGLLFAAAGAATTSWRLWSRRPRDIT